MEGQEVVDGWRVEGMATGCCQAFHRRYMYTTKFTVRVVVRQSPRDRFMVTKRKERWKVDPLDAAQQRSHLWHTMISRKAAFIILLLILLCSLQLRTTPRRFLQLAVSYADPDEHVVTIREPFTDVHRLLFVHVGKAGGETVRYSLMAGCQAMRNRKKREDCIANLPSSALSDRVERLIHVNLRTVPLDQVDGYLIVLRNPLDRALSWYHYSHPDTCTERTQGSPSCSSKHFVRVSPEQTTAQFYRDCFPLVANLTQTHMSEECRTMLGEVWSGSIEPSPGEETFTHMIQNTGWYADEVGLRSPFYVLRTEHLWEDMKSLDITFGGNGTFGDVEGLHYTHGVEAEKDDIPVEGRRRLCCWMKDELLLYRRLLFESENLFPDEAQYSWETAMERCGVASLVDLQQMCGWERASDGRKRSLSTLSSSQAGI